HDEQQQLTRPTLVVLQVHDETVRDLGQGLDDGVELGGAEAYATAVERRVAATRDGARAALADRDPVAVAPDAGDVLEVRRPVARAVGVTPEADWHRREGLRDDELAEGSDHGPGIVVVR